MSTTALRVSSEVLLQSNRNIMLHFNGLSWSVPHRWEHCQPTFAKYVGTFLGDVFGESYKRFSLKSVCAELNSIEPLKGIWTSFLPFYFFFSDCSRTFFFFFFPFWFGCEELCRRGFGAAKISQKQEDAPSPEHLKPLINVQRQALTSRAGNGKEEGKKEGETERMNGWMTAEKGQNFQI